MAGPLPRKANQRRKGAFLQDAKSKKPSSSCSPTRRPFTLPRKRLLWRVLSPHASKLGAAQATTATAHKLARVIYHVLRTKTPYNETVFHECDEQARQRTEN